MRWSVMEKIIEMQRLRHHIRLYEIIIPQVHMLQEYSAKLEGKHGEGLGRLSRKLVALSHVLPLESAKVTVICCASQFISFFGEFMTHSSGSRLNRVID